MATDLANFTEVQTPDVGSDEDNWGSLLNIVLQVYDRALAGAHEISVNAIGATTTLTNQEAQHGVINITGTLTQNLTVSVPNRRRVYLVRNSATGTGFDVTFAMTGGTGTCSVPKGTTCLVAVNQNGTGDASLASPPMSNSGGFPDAIRHPGRSFDGPGIFFADRVTGLARRGSGVLAVTLFAADRDYIRINLSNTEANPMLALLNPFDDGNDIGLRVPLDGVLAVVTDGSDVAHFGQGMQMVGASGSDPGAGGINAAKLQINGVDVISGKQVIDVTTLVTGSKTYTQSHTLAVVPKIYGVLRCRSADLGYSVNEEFLFGTQQSDADADQGVHFSATSSNVSVIQQATPKIPNKSSPGTLSEINVGRWDYRLILEAS